MKSIVVKDAKTLNDAVNYISELDYSVPALIQISEYKSKRSVAANRLYWGWLADISKTDILNLSGNDTEYWHRFMKYKFLVPIFLASKDKLDYQEMWHSVEALKGSDYNYSKIVKFVVDNTSTTDANDKQFSEYLSSVQSWCGARGVILRTDNELIKQAMGYV